MPNMNVTKRNPAADLIRILALFCVISVHFFLNNGYYTQVVSGGRMYVMTLMRSFFIICVPLFLMLSGYLLRKKKLEKSYYGRVTKILLTYVLASFLCIAYTVLFQKQNMTAKDMLFGLLGFSAAPYSWYIEMYLGLFLLIPFLNIVYNALPSQKAKLWLIATFLILTSLPAAFNIFDLSDLSWWPYPASSSTMTKVFPDWWQAFYPIPYYLIGCYLSEYGLKINKGLNMALIVLCTLISGTFCFWRNYNAVFIWGPWCSYQSPFNIVLTTLVFALFLNTNYDKMPSRLVRIIQKISGLALGAYLVSWIFDTEFYPKLAEKVPAVVNRLEYYVIIVPVVFVLSLLASYIISWLQLLLEKGASLLMGALKKS